MHVLFVEPQLDLGKLLAESLSGEDTSVDHAFNAQEAVHMADEKKPDVVVLELNLAGHNGLEFLYEFRSHSDWSGIPVVIYSHVSPEEAGLSEAAKSRLGIVEHLYKPLTTLDKLQNTVRGAVLEPAK